MIKLDLHTHSTASPDGGITPEIYRKVIASGLLDCIAITDHNTIATAVSLHAELGNKIIVGEEIMTSHGEIIGLFLHEPVAPYQTPEKTIEAIKRQNGLVYIPHPFETVRAGLGSSHLEKLQDSLDIIEVFNGRAVFQKANEKTAAWALNAQLCMAASSDAHARTGLGGTYMQVTDMPSAETLRDLLLSGITVSKRPHLRHLLSPKANRLRQKLRKLA